MVNGLSTMTEEQRSDFYNKMHIKRLEIELGHTKDVFHVAIVMFVIMTIAMVSIACVAGQRLKECNELKQKIEELENVRL